MSKLRTFARRATLALGAVLTVTAALAAYVQVDGIPRYDPPPAARVETRVTERTAARVEQGAKLAGMMCAPCHEDTATHRFTGKHLPEIPSEFGTVYSQNITGHPTKGIGGWSDGQLRWFLRTGVRPDGRYAGFMIKLPHTSDEDLDAIIAFLRSDDPRVAAAEVDPPGTSQPSFLAKALAHTPIFRPLPYPEAPVVAPPRSDAVAYGRYLVFSLDCFGCHSADFKSVNAMEPEKSAGFMGGGNTLRSTDGQPIHSANLTPDPETGIGRWSQAEFVRALKHGFRPDGRVLHYPMEPRAELDDEQAAAIYSYLRTVPPLHNVVSRPAAPSPAIAADRSGKALYQRYGCVSCHGESGVGAIGDLSHANETYPSDAALRRWIDEAPSLKPGTRMPGWKGMIAEEDYAPLMEHVRTLSAARTGRTAMAPKTP